MSDNDKTLNEIVSALLAERKRDYRNKLILRSLFVLTIIFIIFFAPMAKDINFNNPHIALIEVNGLISSETQSSAEKIIPLLHKAS